MDAATVNWLTQTSFAPPLIAVGIKDGSKTHSYVKDTGVFAVNVISGDQINIRLQLFQDSGERRRFHRRRKLRGGTGNGLPPAAQFAGLVGVQSSG